MKFEGIIRSIQNNNRNISYEDYFYKHSMGSFINHLEQVKLLSIIQDGTVCTMQEPEAQWAGTKSQRYLLKIPETKQINVYQL